LLICLAVPIENYWQFPQGVTDASSNV